MEDVSITVHMVSHCSIRKMITCNACIAEAGIVDANLLLLART